MTLITDPYQNHGDPIHDSLIKDYVYGSGIKQGEGLTEVDHLWLQLSPIGSIFITRIARPAGHYPFKTIILANGLKSESSPETPTYNDLYELRKNVGGVRQHVEELPLPPAINRIIMSYVEFQPGYKIFYNVEKPARIFDDGDFNLEMGGKVVLLRWIHESKPNTSKLYRDKTNRLFFEAFQKHYDSFFELLEAHRDILKRRVFTTKRY